MRNFIQVTQITSNNCGGNGAWMDNPLNTPSPGKGEWLGFQLGGGRKRKMRKMRKMRKTRQVRKRRMSRKTKKRQSKFRRDL